MNRLISRIVSGVLALGFLAEPALAGSVGKPRHDYALQDFVEIQEPDASALAPIPPGFWERYKATAGSGDHPSSGAAQEADLLIGAEIGSVLIDAIVNLGKAIWDIIQKGEPQLNITTDVASGVPQGIQDWTQLQSWKDPVSKLYRAQLLVSDNDSLGDIYFRLVFTYGGNYRNQGQYLANVTIIPALVRVPYARDFYAKTQIEQLMNQGTTDQPVAGMTLLLQWGVTELLGGNTEQSIQLHVRGDGTVDALPGPSDDAEQIDAPLTTTQPKPPSS